MTTLLSLLFALGMMFLTLVYLPLVSWDKSKKIAALVASCAQQTALRDEMIRAYGSAERRQGDKSTGSRHAASRVGMTK